MLKVEMPKDISPWGWVWVIITVVFFTFTVLFSYVMPFQQFVVDTTGWNQITVPATLTSFWLVWFVLGHNKVTVFLAKFEHWLFHAYGMVGALVLMASITLLPVLGVAVGYIWENGQSAFWLLGAALIIMAIVGVWNYIRGRRSATTVSSK